MGGVRRTVSSLVFGAISSETVKGNLGGDRSAKLAKKSKNER